MVKSKFAFKAWMGTAALLLLPFLSTAQATFTFQVQQPTPNQIVGNQLNVQVAVQSTYQLQSVTASVDGFTSNLVFSSTLSAWTTTISLLGTPRGPATLTITASDVFGNTGQTQTTVLKDLPPVLTVTAPVPGTVARPQVQLSASATDDSPVGTWITVTEGTNLLASGTNSINTLASIPDNDGQAVGLRFDAIDSVGQTDTVWQTVYVFTNANWREAASVEGPILQVTTNTILFVNGNQLETKSRISGTETVLLNDPTITPSDGALTPHGAIFVSEDGTVNANVYEVNNGAVINLGYGQGLEVQGTHAIWTSGGSSSGDYLWLRDLTGSTNVNVSTIAAEAVLVPNGDVVYVADLIKSTGNAIMRYRNGTNSLIANGSYYYIYRLPQSDGTNVAYEKCPYPIGPTSPCYVTLLKGSTENPVATNDDPGFGAFGGTLLMNEAWLAFTETGAFGVQQVWTRSPEGTQTQQSFFGTSSRVKALAPTGEVIIINGGQLYLPRQGSPPLDLGAWNFLSGGQVFWQEGHWYVQLGRSLLVLSQSPVITAAGSNANGGFKLLLEGPPGDTVIAQSSTNFVDWSSFATNVLTSGGIEVIDPSGSGTGSRFYRAFVPPP